MSRSSSESWSGVSILVGEGAPSADVEQHVLLLFDRCAGQLLRYALSLGLTKQEAEDVVQDTFLALFRHLRLNRPQDNLRAWLFQVTHNLALKERRRLTRELATGRLDEDAAARCPDPSLDPEARVLTAQRRRRVASVVRVLPERDRQCLFMRAAGLTYRDIAAALGVSLGAVGKSLTRATTRLINAEKAQGEA